MEGKKGTDKVVPVPLGTLVWQLLELKSNSTSDASHGVTALAHSPIVPGSPALPFQPDIDAEHGQVAGRKVLHAQQQTPLMQACPVHHSQHGSGKGTPSSSSSSSSRSRLFADDQLLRPASLPHVTTAATTVLPEWSGTAAAVAQPDGLAVNGHIDELATAEDHQPCDSAPGGSSEDQEAALCQQLLTGQFLLTNAEKLHLLHHGRLPPGSVHQQAAMDGGGAGQAAGERRAGPGRAGSAEPLQPRRGEEANDDEVTERQFTKQQVSDMPPW
jgi:hypothetical protein